MCVRVCAHSRTMSHRRVLASVILSLFEYAYHTTFHLYLVLIHTRQQGKAAGIALSGVGILLSSKVCIQASSSYCFQPVCATPVSPSNDSLALLCVRVCVYVRPARCYCTSVCRIGRSD